MGRFCYALLGMLLLAATLPGVPTARAGDEDSAQETKAKPEREAPADTALPEDQEEPEMSMGGQPEEKSPEFQDETPAAASPAGPVKKTGSARSLDDNIDYSGILGAVETGEAPRGVLAPAEGFRGYRPNMVAVGYGDRTPGWGGMIEYSWNRIGAGVFGSVLSARSSPPAGSSAARTTTYQSFGGLYGLYRFLPWGVSPYFLLGLEAANNAEEPLGGLAGGGVEARIYRGWTLLFGWSYHSTARKGFLGGAVGWSF